MGPLYASCHGKLQTSSPARVVKPGQPGPVFPSIETANKPARSSSPAGDRLAPGPSIMS